jgi:3-phenylpropionate/trans-cinnamate dioxygenase ferredoxin reductase subunit
MSKRYTYVVVGGGRAGASAVEGIRLHDTRGTIGLFSKENHLPYDRPPLSKGLWIGKSRLADVPVYDEAFYRTNGVDVHLNIEITAIDRTIREVNDAHGNRFGYDRLLLATGGEPRPLALGKETLPTFRTLDDFVALHHEAESLQEFLLIGGGFIGAELAASLALNNKKVTVLFPERTLLERVLPPDLASYVTAYYRTRGVTILDGDLPVAARREGQRTIVTTREGRTLSADRVIAAIGLNVNSALAERAGLVTRNGIVVDALLRTSDPDIFAAGDVALFPASRLGADVRVEHWDNARAQGLLAGENMTGAEKRYDYLPYFYSDLFDLGFEAVGELDSRHATVADWKEPFREGVVYYLADSRIKGVLLWNVWEKVDAARALIGSDESAVTNEKIRKAL